MMNNMLYVAFNHGPPLKQAHCVYNSIHTKEHVLSRLKPNMATTIEAN